MSRAKASSGPDSRARPRSALNGVTVAVSLQEPSLYTVKAVIILDNDGDRLFAKYYDDTYPSAKEQKAFEKNIFNKTHRTDSEIALLEGLTVVYKSSIDLYFYVIGSSHENELMLTAVLNCLFDSLSQMLRYDGSWGGPPMALGGYPWPWGGTHGPVGSQGLAPVPGAVTV
ncbi:PREDICTED: coatomer subunit zeta-1 [Nipponia nippon]|nr:PREDICTED: coatomer subunit zeta-1 [Nipponia nippon]